jgi:hypothetical protein
MRIGWFAKCTSGGSYIVADRLNAFPLSSTGVFGEPFTIPRPQPDGSKASYAYNLSGKVGKTRATGTLQVKETDTDAAGATTDACDTAAIHWSARSSAPPPHHAHR